MNRSKGEICDIIKEKVDFYLHKADYEKDADARNYIVSYNKVHSLGFDTTISLERGIDELINAMSAIKIVDPFRNV